jgi:hypothetical protein
VRRSTLKGIHIVKTRNADGVRVEYHYAWRGGPRLYQEPGTAAYVREFAGIVPAEEAKAIADALEKWRAKSADRQQRRQGQHARLTLVEEFNASRRTAARSRFRDLQPARLLSMPDRAYHRDAASESRVTATSLCLSYFREQNRATPRNTEARRPSNRGIFGANAP